jgi:aspartate carbamoyltransferase regulatory subunit
MLIEDFERESQKDLVYLLEARMLMQEEIKGLEEVKPAKIVIIDESKIHKDGKTEEPEILPF